MDNRLNIALLACALLAALPASAQRLYKYTDPATGKTVYTERLPAEAAGGADLVDAPWLAAWAAKVVRP